MGFTLLELLVTISIIGILMALATVSFTTAQKNGRDSRRRADVENVRKALEQYYAINTEYSAVASAALLVGGSAQRSAVDPKNDGTLHLRSHLFPDHLLHVRHMEQTGRGNASANDCSSMTAGDYYCAQNLQ